MQKDNSPNFSSFREDPVRFGYGSGVERFELFRLSLRGGKP